MNQKTCIIIVGPTAVGKTTYAIQLAQHFQTSIISADSRQCFIELNIGVAKPTSAELSRVKHYFINSHHIQQEVNAALFEKLSLKWCDEIFRDHDTVIMVGGTGLYVKAFAEGLDETPPTDGDIRKKIIDNYNTQGIAWLQKELKDRDPEFAKKGEMQNPQRMMRALEVQMISGKSIFSFRDPEQKERAFRIIKLGLDLPRQELYERINARVDVMIHHGLLEEAKELYSQRELNALQTVGYKELFDYFDGKISLQKAIDLIKQNSRHYAKRQLTWFKKDDSIHWIDSLKTAASTEFVDNLVRQSIDWSQHNLSN
jgi:tRNA dimethylallyltransferase